MGQPKQLIEIEGEPLVRRAVRMALEAGCGSVFVVLGSDAEAVESALAGLTVVTVLNAGWEAGMASSIGAGISALPENTKAVLLLTCDQPAVDRGFLVGLLAAHSADPERTIGSAYANTVGIPALFPRSSFEALKGLPGDRGARQMLENENVLSLPLPNGELDLDTPEDLARIQ